MTAYAASKFGLEGWMESLQAEVAAFGINTTIVNPGFFRTELLNEKSTNTPSRPSPTLPASRPPAEYLESREWPATERSCEPRPRAVSIAEQNPPPRRFIAGADAIAGAEQRPPT